jgi:hypothetical protein
LEDLDIGRRIILRWILKKTDGVARTGIIWLNARNQWRALVNTVMNLRVP